MILEDIKIVLCRPAEEGNVGAVCRALKNMGLSRLALVLPGEIPHPGDTQITGLGAEAWEIITTRAVHARDVWEKAEIRTTLEEAVADCPLVIGTTRRRGHLRKQVTMTARECAAFLAGRPGPAALVFGNERTGLDDRELSCCSLASHIPAHEAFPSLNLSHAVQIYAYEIYLACGSAQPVKGEWVPLERDREEVLVREITHQLALLGFYHRPGREEQARFLRDLFARAALTEWEAEYLTRIVNRAVHLALRGKAAHRTGCQGTPGSDGR